MPNAPFAPPFPVLAGLRAESPLAMAATFVRHKVASGAFVFQEGDAPEAVYLVSEGLVKVVKHSSRSEPSTLDFLVPGRLFGMIAVLDKKPYPVSAVACRDSVICRVSASSFEDLLRRYPDFNRDVYRQLGDHVRNAHDLRVAMEEPAPRRLAMILCSLYRSVGPELRVLREDLAAMAGTTVGTTVRELAALRRLGAIETGWKRIRIRRIDVLRSRCEPPRK